MNDIVDEFETASFGDVRTDRRSKKILADMYDLVGSGLRGSCQGSAEIKAAYRFLDSNIVDTDKILKPHYAQTIERIRKYKIVGFDQDTTDIDMKHMSSVEDLGVLNDTDRPGYSLHPVIAFTPEKLCLGVVHTEVLIRNPEDLGKKPDTSRPIEDKESYRWIKGYHATCKIAEQCPDTLCVSIGDRESDIFELLVEATNPENKAELIARAWHDRKITVQESDENTNKHQDLTNEINNLTEENKLLVKKNSQLKKNKKIEDLREEKRKEFEDNKLLISQNKEKIKKNNSIINEDEKIVSSFTYQIKKGEIVGTAEFILPAGRGRKSRPVKQNIRTATLTVPPPLHKKHLPSISINVVYLEEIDIPAGESPVNWMLLTTLPVDSLEAAQLVVDLYLSRWGIEMFFKVLKSGCKIEELRFKSANRLMSCVAMYMIVAWRVMYATYLGRECPDAPCSFLFDDDEWHSVYAVIKKSKPPELPPSLGEFTKMIATLGGFKGRNSDGHPGIKAMWQGIQAMHRLAAGWSAYREFGEPSSHKIEKKKPLTKKGLL